MQMIGHDHPCMQPTPGRIEVQNCTLNDFANGKLRKYA